MSKFVKKYFVGSGDMDINYHLTKIAAAKYFQETFALYCAKNNLAAFDVCDNGLIWVISDLHIEFLESMPYWSEEFFVEMWISEKTISKTFADFRIFHRGKEIAKGDSCWYLLDMNTKRPVKTKEILKPFEVCDEKVFGEREKVIYKTDGEKIAEHEHAVTVRDLDFNHHVNNLSYIGMAMETVPSEYFDKYSVSGYKTKFLKEAFLDDILKCEIFHFGEDFICRIYDKKDNADVCFVIAKYGEKQDKGRNPREYGVIFE